MVKAHLSTTLRLPKWLLGRNQGPVAKILAPCEGPRYQDGCNRMNVVHNGQDLPNRSFSSMETHRGCKILLEFYWGSKRLPIMRGFVGAFEVLAQNFILGLS